MEYLTYFKGNFKATGYVTAGQPVNAMIVAAQMMRSKDVLERVEKEKKEKAKKLGCHPGFVVKEGNIIIRIRRSQNKSELTLKQTAKLHKQARL